MTNIFLDIETLPEPNGYERFLKEEKANFKAPKDLTKTQACADLGLKGDDAKYTSKDDAIRMWEERFAEEKSPEVAEDKWRKTSFDGAKGQICSIAWAKKNDDVSSITIDGFSEKEALEEFAQILKSDRINTYYFIGHNIRFDLKFLYRRFVILGIDPGFKLPFDGRHKSDFYCTSEAWAGFNQRISQKDLAEVLGFKGKPDDIDGSQVFDYYQAGKIAEIEEYNRFDVETVRKIYNRLNFIQG